MLFLIGPCAIRATCASGTMNNRYLRTMETSYTSSVVPTTALITQANRASLKQQRPLVVWFTGMSGAGKSTLACLLDKELHARGFHTFLLDGDNLRLGLNNDLGFSDASRHESIRRAAEVSRLMVDAGLIVIASFISPFRADRDAARALFAIGQFFEVHVDAPLAVVEARDTKGLYRKARQGELLRFTGIDSPYEVPINPELRVNTAEVTPYEALQGILVSISALLGRHEVVDHVSNSSAELAGCR
ncbi:adenylyl-sulfate kinase [Paraburkholderia sp. RP-4-7]|uniref:Adenylyl-sulfate kinase n=1 Tax=Paraburkholderia polaris TaxID=2728848 RepID=A0A848IPT9_9BURK|nr:adenylyl-sulfate kinase [Paraburkholderia polaris]NMM04348.1 adenylyl-sulfate kinase [Paraburkholderia polaris]